MQHFIYRIKITLRQKSGIFWAMVFPIFLGLLFYLMFGNIGKLEQFSNIKVGIIKEDNEQQKTFLKLMKDVETDEGVKMFDIKEYKNEEEALKALEDKEIEAYIQAGDELKMTAARSDIKSSIVKSFLDQYEQNVALITEVAMKDPMRLQTIVDSISDEVTIKEIPLKGADKDPYTQYFYALISMTCLIASMMGMSNGVGIQANLSTLGARRNVAPTRKMTQVLSDFLASLFLYCIMTTVVLGVIIFGFKQDFGENTLFILLGTWVGCFTGLAGGMMIGVVPNGNEKSKQGLCVAFFMVSSFLSGLQWANITYYIEKNCPIINRINPATLIVNSFKSLAVFGDTRQYAVNQVTLLALGVLFLVISILKLRRTKYASI